MTKHINKRLRSHIWFALWSWLQMRRCDVFLHSSFFKFCLLHVFFLLIIYLFIFMFWLNYYHNVQHHLLRWYKKLQSLQKNVQLCFIKIWKLTSVWQGFITVIINYASVENVHLIENAWLCFACCPPSSLLLRTFDMHIHITSLFRILFFLPTK